MVGEMGGGWEERREGEWVCLHVPPMQISARCHGHSNLSSEGFSCPEILQSLNIPLLLPLPPSFTCSASTFGSAPPAKILVTTFGIGRGGAFGTCCCCWCCFFLLQSPGMVVVGYSAE